MALNETGGNWEERWEIVARCTKYRSVAPRSTRRAALWHKPPPRNQSYKTCESGPVIFRQYIYIETVEYRNQFPRRCAIAKHVRRVTCSCIQIEQSARTDSLMLHATRSLFLAPMKESQGVGPALPTLSIVSTNNFHVREPHPTVDPTRYSHKGIHPASVKMP